MWLMQCTETYTKSLPFLTGPLKKNSMSRYDRTRFLTKKNIHKKRDTGDHDIEIFKGSYPHLLPRDTYR